MAREKGDLLMGVGAWIMLAVGATLLWGGLVAAIVNYLRTAGSGGSGD